MTNKEIRRLRKSIGFSMRDVSDHLQITKSTYQRYEDGSAIAPASVVESLVDLEKSVSNFMTTINERIDKRIKEDRVKGEHAF